MLGVGVYGDGGETAGHDNWDIFGWGGARRWIAGRLSPWKPVYIWGWSGWGRDFLCFLLSHILSKISCKVVQYLQQINLADTSGTAESFKLSGSCYENVLQAWQGFTLNLAMTNWFYWTSVMKYLSPKCGGAEKISDPFYSLPRTRKSNRDAS